MYRPIQDNGMCYATHACGLYILVLDLKLLPWEEASVGQLVLPRGTHSAHPLSRWMPPSPDELALHD